MDNNKILELKEDLEELKEDLEEQLNEINIVLDISQYSSWEEISEILIETIQKSNNITYFSNAIEYLKEHDASLCESMELAEEQGFTLQDINSELLATLLYQTRCIEAVLELEDEFENFFELKAELGELKDELTSQLPEEAIKYLEENKEYK